MEIMKARKAAAAMLLLLLALLLGASAAAAADAPRCAGLAPACHIQQRPICICTSEWRRDCSWVCAAKACAAE